MNTKAPNPRQLVALGTFVLACFGLTLYMWVVFGGGSPLKPKGYRIEVPFKDAAGLTLQADVRISGVNVGKVKGKRLDRAHGVTLVEVEIDSDHAPRPSDTHAILRQKTVLGETYVQLSPGSPDKPPLHDGDTIAPGQVDQIVHLDDVLRTFDPETRNLLATWLTGQGEALADGGPALNAALAQLPPFGRYGGDLLEILNRQDKALSGLVSDGGTSLAALTERRGELRDLIGNSSRVFRATAARSDALADTIRVLPTFLRETRQTVVRFADFSDEATPLVRQLRPAARELAPVLEDTRALAPDLKRLLTAVGPLANVSRRGLPALGGVLDNADQLLTRLRPYLGTLVPVVDYLAGYKHELTALFANVAAATQPTLPANDGSGPLHYARASLPINPESLTAFPKRLGTSRSNPYPAPGSYTKLLGGLDSFGNYLCTTTPPPSLSADIPEETRTMIRDAYFTDDPSGPACRAQPPLAGELGSYPRLRPLP